MSVADTIAVIAGKLSARAIRMAGAGLGSNLPGRVSRAISPAVLGNLARQSRKGVLAVSGTNGKSTTTGFVSSILEKNGTRIAHNRQGANLVTGITASLVDAASWTGGLDADFCLFEIDEAALPLVAKEVPIEKVIVTNLFRDQLDRFGELDTTASLIAKGIRENKSQSILNADDPNVAQLVPECPRTYYGIETVQDQSSKQEEKTEIPAAGTQELSYCSACGSEIVYDKVFYGQIGHWRCSKCTNARPAPNVVATNVKVEAAGSSFVIQIGGSSLDVIISLPGLFNVYNALAATALASALGISLDVIAQGLSGYTTLFGRSERVVINGKTALLQLIKNPAGASQTVRSAASDPDGRILIAINDNYADGRDISWLWDAEFELLGQHKRPIFVSGVRAYDMAVRLKYCGVPPENIIVVQPLDKALQQGLDSLEPGQTLWVLPTYTCLLELQKIVKSMGYALSGT